MTYQRFRIVLTGSREWIDDMAIHRVLNELLEIKGLVYLAHGAAPGVDTTGKQWCITTHAKNFTTKPNPVAMKSFPAKWRVNGVFDRSAGLTRNEQMVRTVQPDLVIAFIRNNSRGATHCARFAIQHHFETFIFRDTGDIEHWVAGELKQRHPELVGL